MKMAEKRKAAEKKHMAEGGGCTGPGCSHYSHGGMAKAKDEEEPKEAPMADEDAEMGGDEELHHAIAGELMDGLEKKDKKQIAESMRAFVMACGGKV